jgi:hypothetical protein
MLIATTTAIPETGSIDTAGEPGATFRRLMRPSHLVIVAALLGNVLLAGCTKQNPLYCSMSTPRECPMLSAAICDEKLHECRECKSDPECAALDRGTPACVAGTCKECNSASDCKGPSQPICEPQDHVCAGCSSGNECAAKDASKPVCLGSGGCVECGKDSDCTAPGKHICDMNQHTCRGCGGNSECAAISAAKPVCGPAGACIGCAVDADCKATPATAVCDLETTSCRGCEASSECVAIDANKPVCLTTGLCVECNADRDCKGATKPICDVAAHTCRGCQADSECPAEPGVCMAHVDGHCAIAAETIYVQEQGPVTCSDTAPAPPAFAATKDTPACSLRVGLELFSASRPLIVVRGAVYSGGAAPIATTETFVHSIVGQQNAVVTALEAAVTLRSGTAYLRGLKLGSAYGAALTATGGTLLVDGVTIDASPKGGILLDGAAFDIRYTTVTNSGPGPLDGVPIGGILVRTVAAAGPKLLTNLTLRDNTPFDLSCARPIMGSGIFTLAGADGDCGVTTCTAPGPTCGAVPFKTSQSP